MKCAIYLAIALIVLHLGNGHEDFGFDDEKEMGIGPIKRFNKRPATNRRRAVIATRRSCRVKELPTNGGADSEIDDYIFHGESVFYYCNNGYRLHGFSNSHCNNGYIIGPVPECKPK